MSQLRDEGTLGIATMMVDSGIELLDRVKFAHLQDPKRINILIEALEFKRPDITEQFKVALAQQYSPALANSFGLYFQKLEEFRQLLIQIRDEQRNISDVFDMLKTRVQTVADAYDQFYADFRERK